LRKLRTAVIVAAIAGATLGVAPSSASAATTEVKPMAGWVEHRGFKSEFWCDLTRATWLAAGYPTAPTHGCYRDLGGYWFGHYQP
jgi:hypothetical protein